MKSEYLKKYLPRYYNPVAAYLATLTDREYALRAAEDFALVAKENDPSFDAQNFYNDCGLGVN